MLLMSERAMRSAIAFLCTTSFGVGMIAASPAFAVLPVGLTQDLTLTHDSELRRYDVLLPASAGATPRALVVDLHGFTSNGNEQRALSGWDAIADTNGFLVAWPDGLFNSWNGGTCCGTAVANNVDDVGFIRAMVAAIQAEANIDSERIYVTGLSNGGAMSHRVACDAADLFAAAAPMAFPVPYLDFATECNPSEPIKVLLFMGLTDVLVPYGTAAPSFADWRDKNACDSAGDPVEVAEIYGGSDCEIDTSCGERGVEVGLCSVRGSAFDPPLDVNSGHILYINDDAFDISQRAWEFMEGSSIPMVPALPAPLLLVGALMASAVAVVKRRLATAGSRG